MSRKRLSQRTAAGSLRREIPSDFKYDPKKVKHLKKILHNTNIALGTLVSALGEFMRIKSVNLSPDGHLGGLGYVMPIKDMKEALNSSVKSLSEVADSLADELTNPAWHVDDDEEVKKLIQEKDEIEEKTENLENVPEQENDENNDEDSEKTEEPSENTNDSNGDDNAKEQEAPKQEPPSDSDQESEMGRESELDIDKIFPPESRYGSSKAMVLDDKVREALRKSFRQ
jgi:uncharacterized phage infection (PIP) family protein YhgE